MRECRKTHHLSNAKRAKGYGFQDINSGEFLHPVEEFSATIKTRAREDGAIFVSGSRESYASGFIRLRRELTRGATTATTT